MEPIAIVGSGCRFPGGANTPSKLWELLQNPRDVLSRISDTRFNAKAFHHPDGLHHGTSNVQHSYLLSEDFRQFDESFFKIKPDEAESIDPQQRLLLETVYEALEAGGLTIEKLRGSNTAVFVGQMISDYNDHLIRDLDNLPTYFATGTSRAITSNRISYFFDWHGPSSTVDTACSSSLVALHQAVQSLRSGECSTAVVGGVNLLLGPEWYIGESKLKMLSPEGRSRMWDATANGYARGEGIAAIIVKRLSEAIEAGDHIECVIRETGVNQDGHTQGITMPNNSAQTALIRDTYARAGLDLTSALDMPQFFEAHGTGTQAGDVKEAQAIADAFSGVPSKERPLFVGSIKTIIGHTEGTAGLAGILKVSLALQNSVIPPNMLFNRLNPAIEPFYENLQILTKAQQWPELREGQPRRASVNSFGFGGTNAHAILESYTQSNPIHESETANERSTILPYIFSAVSASSLARTIEAYSSYLRKHPSTNLADFAYTLASHRSRLPIRIAFSADSTSMLSNQIDKRLEELQGTPGSILGVRLQRTRLLGIFTGQGAQWPEMGKELLQSSSLARRSFDILEKSLSELPPDHRPRWSLREEIMRVGTSSRISEAEISQPACTAIQIVIVDLLASFGVKFTAVIGHSSGEIAAAYASGYLSAGCAIKIAYYRGFFARFARGPNDQKGAMMAVAASYEEAKDFCESAQMRGRISVAASNSPTTVTLSGDLDAIQESKAIFDQKKVFARILKVSTAYHSHHMLGCAEAYLDALRDCQVQVKSPGITAKCAWYSSVKEGVLMENSRDLADTYWRDNMVQPVLFTQALRSAMIGSGGNNCNLILEIGPHPALKGPAQQTIQDLAESKQISESSIPYSGTLMRGMHDNISIAESIGFLWMHGADELITLECKSRINSPIETRTRPKLLMGLPGYSWDHGQIHWKESRLTKAFRLREAHPDQLLGTQIMDGTEQDLRWRNLIRPRELPWLSGHRLQGQIVFPASAYASMAIQAAQSLPPIKNGGTVRLFEVLDLSIGRPITFDNEMASVETLFTMHNLDVSASGSPKSENHSYCAMFSCYSSTNGGSTSMQLVASGRIRLEMGDASASTLIQSTCEIADTDLRSVSDEDFYLGLEKLGYQYNGDFRTLSSLQRKLNIATGMLPNYGSSSLVIHPTTLDLALQSALVAFCAPGDADLWSLHVPISVDRITINPFWSRVQQQKQQLSDVKFALLPFRASLLDNDAPNAIFGDVSVFADNNVDTWIQVEGLSMVPLSTATASDDRLLFAHNVWGVSDPISGSTPCQPVSGICDIESGRMSEQANVYQAVLPQMSLNHLALLVTELAHRYQSMNILEIRSSDDEAAPGVRTQFQGPFTTYTIATDVRSSIRDKGEEHRIQGIGKDTSFKHLDFQDDLLNQGFVKGSYDLIIMAIPLVGISGKQQELTALRALLRRGGYLMGSFRVGLSGLSSSESKVEMASLLRAGGFSDIDDGTNEDFADQPSEFFTFVTQTNDDQVSRLRKPLSSVPIKDETGKPLLLVGEESCLHHEIRTLLEHHHDEILSVKRIEDVVEANMPETYTVLCLVEIEEPMFKSMTREKLEGLKVLFRRATNVLWISAHAKENPLFNMTKGFARSVQSEYSQLIFQFLDFAQLEASSARVVAEALLRLEITESWKNNGLHQDILWTTEPEYVFDNGRMLVSRILPLNDANNRHNSTRRDISKQVNPNTCNVRMVQSGSFPNLAIEEDRECLAPDASTEDWITITVMYSTLSAVQISNTSRVFLSLGRIEPSGEIVIALSGNTSSRLRVMRRFVFVVEPPQGQEDRYLSLVFDLLLAQRLLDLASTRGNLLIHEPSNSLHWALSKLACVENGLKRVYFTTQHTDSIPQSIFIQSSSPTRLVKSLIPANVSVYLNFSSESGSNVSAFIKKCINPPCHFLDKESCFGPLGYYSYFESVDISIALELALNLVPVNDMSHPTISVRDITLSPSPLSVVKWVDSPPIPVKIAPILSHVLFADNKTYVLFGLTGPMGRSITEWMIACGARYVVLTCQSPEEVDEAWLASFNSSGAMVKFLKCDLSNEASIQSCYEEICKTLPRITGIAHGATVLQNTLFDEMTPEAMHQVLEPKVLGSRHLDDIFSSKHPLDFFILFSSIVSETGSMGQSMYAAANSYLVALASQRRSRGLSAAAIDLGVVSGLGCVEQSSSDAMATARENDLFKISPGRMSERDVHTMFAEAILMSRQDPSGDPLIIGGLTIVKPTDVSKPYWYENPRFQWWTPKLDDGGSDTTKAKDAGNKSLAMQLLSAKSEEYAHDILREAFFSFLKTSLRIETNPDLLVMGLDELGIDSLSALDIRTWFKANVQADVPIMKILGGATVDDLLKYSLERMTRNVDTAAEGLTPQETKSTQSVPNPLAFQRTQQSDSSGDSPQSCVLRTEKLSMGQSRFWFLRSYLEDKTTSNIVASHRLRGDLRISDLAEAVKELGQRHESLRTFFFDEGDINQARQGVLETSLLRLQILEVSTKEQVRTEHLKLLGHEYDLERGDTMRIVLCSLPSASEYYILIAYHHIIMDGMSLRILLADLDKFYQRQSNLSQMIQYPDFSLRQRMEINDDKFTTELEFWRGEFPDVPPALPLFSLSRVNSRQTLKKYHLNKATVRLSSISTQSMRAVSREAKTTAFHFYLAVFKSLIERFTGANDFCIGIADANRNDFDTVDAIGMYLNLLPLRFQSKKGESFRDLLLTSKRKARAALEHSRVPFDLLLETLDVPRSASHSPLFQAFVDYRQGYEREAPFGNCTLDDLVLDAGQTAYDISLDIMEDPSTESVITIKAQSSLFSQEDTELLMKSYINLIEAYAAKPDCLVENPSLFSKADVQKAIEIGQGPHLRSDWPETLSHRIDDMISCYSAQLAIKDGLGHALTYSQMSQRVHLIANSLLDAGVELGSKIAVFQQPTADWVCSLLAIFRIGCVYVPLDLRNPLERLAANVEAAKPSAILADDTTIHDTPSLKGGNAKCIDVTCIKGSASNHPQSFSSRASSESPAVILFTSGTTGTPKGIILRHSSLRNEIEGYTKTWGIASEMILQQSAFSFDFSLDQIFSALSTGSTLYIVPKEQRGDPVEIAKIIAREKITYTKATPSEYVSWIRYGLESLTASTSWRKAFAGGERLTDQHRQLFRSLNIPELQLMNSYGPGEISISSHKIVVPYKEGDPEAYGEIPAGKCLPNYSVYIVDENLDPVPIGIPGEVLIGGAGPALGYLANEVLTREKFLPNKFACPEYVKEGWNTLYRSSDRGRLTPDGALLFEGRIDGDSQIKLRGLRIELQDIESTIVRTSNGALTDAVVSLRGDPEFLVAHVVFSPSYPHDRRDVLLRDVRVNLPLPQYMHPTRIISLDRMPLTSHLKLDRRAIKSLPLPKSSAPQEKRLGESAVLEISDTEKWLRDLWLTILPPDSVEISAINSETDFFAVGGNSMIVPGLQLKIRQSLGAVIPLFEFFAASTLGAMAARIKESNITATIDWSQETSLYDLDIELGGGKGNGPILQTRRAGGKVVLLTGATGFLGRQILKRLVADPTISEVNVVAVRAQSGFANSRQRFDIQTNKIKTYDGDLTMPLLGLGEEDFISLAGKTDAIIHSGAMRSFFENYETLRGANFHSTKEIIRIARPRQIPIHFISSGRLLTWETSSKGISSSQAGSLARVVPPTNGTEGYLATKWASEVVLEKAGAKYGAPVYIHRALPMDGSNDSDKYAEVMRSFGELSIAANALPNLEGWTGDFDLVHVSHVVEGICQDLTPKEKKSRPPALFRHYPGQLNITLEQLESFLTGNYSGKGLSQMNVLKWFGRIKILGFEYIISAQNFTKGRLVSRR